MTVALTAIPLLTLAIVFCCIAIGGPALNVLYVTSARIGMGEPALHDGALFRAEGVDVRGLPEARFRR